MPKLTIRTPDDGTPWSQERLDLMTTTHVDIDGEHYPITGGQLDGDRAVLVVDTGKKGPALEAGTATQIGVVE